MSPKRIRLRKVWTQTCTWGELWVKFGAKLWQVKELPEAGERSETDPSLAPSEGVWSSQDLDLGLAASKAVRQQTSVVLSHPVVLHYNGPRKLIPTSCGRQVMVARVVTVAVGEAPTMPKVLHLDPCSGPTVSPVLSWPSDCLAPLSSPQQNDQKEDLFFLVFTQLSF